MEFGKPLTDEEFNQVLREEARKKGTTYVPIEEIRKNNSKNGAAINKPKTKWQELTEEKLIHKMMNLHLHWFLFYPLIFWYLTKNEMHHAIRLHNRTLTEGAFMSGFKYPLILAGIQIAFGVAGLIGGLIWGAWYGITKERGNFKEVLCVTAIAALKSLIYFLPVLKYPAWYVVAFAFLKHAVLPITDWQAQNPDALKILFWVGMVLVVIHVLIAVSLKVREMQKGE